MGGVIFLALVFFAILFLVTPALRRRGARRRQDVEQAAHDAVVRRLDDHRRDRPSPTDDAPPKD